MSRNGSGTYSLPAGNPVVTGTTITSTWANSTLTDIASALTQSVSADGQTPMTGSLNMASNKIISLGTPTATTDAVTKAYADALIGAGSAGVFSSVTDSGLTSGRVTYASTSGLLSDSANMTFDGSTITSSFSGPHNGTVGATTANTGSFTSLAYSTTLTGGTGIVNLGSGQFYKDASGNVGIGTSSPDAKLSIKNPNVSGSQTVMTVLGATSAVDLFAMTANQTTDVIALGTNYAGNLAFNTNSTERMRISSAGVVNIASTLYFYPTGGSAGVNGPMIYNTSTDNMGIVSSGTQAIVFGQNNSEKMRIDSNGNLGIGTSSPSASAILDAQSTTKGVRMPNMTTTQKNAISSPAAGLMVFDTTLAKLCVYSGSAWQTITSV